MDQFLNPRVILFTGEGCAPCAAIKPKVKQFAEAHVFEFRELPVAEHAELAQQHRVSSVPTLLVQDDTGFLNVRAQGMPAILGALRNFKAQ